MLSLKRGVDFCCSYLCYSLVSALWTYVDLWLQENKKNITNKQADTLTDISTYRTATTLATARVATPTATLLPSVMNDVDSKSF